MLSNRCLMAFVGAISLLASGCDPVAAGAGTWTVVADRLEVEVPTLGGDADFSVGIRNESTKCIGLRVARISCGCITAIDTEVSPAPRAEGRLRFQARPRLLVPTDERILLSDIEGTYSREILVTIAARTGLHITPTSVVLREPLDAELRKVAELLVAVPDSAAAPTIISKLLPPDETSIEVITDPPIVRRTGRNIVVFAVAVYVVGLRDSPRLVRECVFEGRWVGGSSRVTLLLTAEVEVHRK